MNGEQLYPLTLVRETVAFEDFIFDATAPVCDWRIEFADTYRERGAVWTIASVYRLVRGIPEENPVLGPSRINLLRESRGGGLPDLEGRLKNEFGSWAWEDFLQLAKLKCLRALNDRLTATTLADKTGDNDGPPFLTKPFLAGNGMSIIYGDGGVGKSGLALTLAIEVVSGVRLVSEKVPPPTGNVLYLDYEDTHDTHHERGMAIIEAHALLPTILNRIHRVKLSDVIAHHVKELLKVAADVNARMVVVDSLGMACGGDITEAEPVIRMGQALRHLGLPVLGIHHNNKAGLPYGSVYLRNMARLMWQAENRPSHSEDDEWTYFLMSNEKANNVPKQPVHYYMTKYVNDEDALVSMRYKPTDKDNFPTADAPPMEGDVGTKGQVLYFLQLHRPDAFTVADLLMTIQWDKLPTVKTVTNRVNDLVQEGKVNKLGEGHTAMYWADE